MPLSKKEERAAKKENACFVIENLPQQMGSGVSEPTGKPTGLLLLLVELDALWAILEFTAHFYDVLSFNYEQKGICW